MPPESVQSSMQPSLLLIIVYLGPLPRMFDLWLESCRRNPHVEWLIANDQEPQHEYPPNVRFLRQSKEQIVSRMEKKVGAVPTRFTPYKLCDYKVAYGVMFEDELTGYDYWGVCDLDMVFGDMASLLDLNALSQYTKLFWHGHLTIYRNTPDVNNLFREPGPGWDPLEVLRCPYYRSLDEKPGVHTVWRMKGLPVYHANLIADIIPKTLRMKARHHTNTDFQVFSWDNGRVVCHQVVEGKIQKQEFLYIHLQKRSMPRGEVPAGSSYFITPNGFIPATDYPPTVEQIAELARPKWPARREFWRRRIKEQFARARRLFTREYLLRQPPADVLPPDVT